MRMIMIQIKIIKEGFLIPCSEIVLNSLESTGADTVEHIVSSYSSLPLHLAIMVKTPKRTGQVMTLFFILYYQCVITIHKTEEYLPFSSMITCGGEWVGELSGEFSLSSV